MDSAKLTARLRKLSASQQSIEGLSEYCVRHRDEAKAIVKLWNAEYDEAPSDRKLACLYLANDILQNSRKGGREFVDEFVEVLPRAVRHLYRGSNEKVRKAVSRLVNIWDERKVLSMGAIKAMKDFFQHEPREGRSHGGKEADEGSRKRMKLVEPLAKAVWDARQMSMKKAEWQANHQKAVEKGIQSQDPVALEMVRKQLGIYATHLQSEITARTNCVEELKNALQDQEQAMRKSKEILRLCLIQQKNAEQAIDSAKEREKHNSPMLPPPEIDSPPHPTMRFHGQQAHDPEPMPPVPQTEQMPHVPQTPQLPSAMQLPDGRQIQQQGHVTSRPPMHPQQLPPPSVQHQIPHEMPPMQQGPPPPPPPPMYPVNQEFSPMTSVSQWNPEQPKAGANFTGFDMGMVSHQIQVNNGGWTPPAHQNSIDPCGEVANGLAASPQAATVLANALEAIPQDKQDEFGFAVADTLNHPQFGFNQPGSWGN